MIPKCAYCGGECVRVERNVVLAKWPDMYMMYEGVYECLMAARNIGGCSQRYFLWSPLDERKHER